ncbi:putative divalent cation/proton antiporter TMEM165 [Parasteatoda tepidariorum]|uniref:putative divalent cation/proton antiporter TMEM165 n=1 Tax=Parasteatoda tepidariorum TaxID=114398 RepID=UPI00077FC916|nr:transmembrane protein 165 [Parasteatoda tepidariorum]
MCLKYITNLMALMRSSSSWTFLLLTIIVINFSVFVNSEEIAPSEPVVSVNRNVEFPGNYEDVGGDFKKPGDFFHKIKDIHSLGFVHGFVAAISVIIVSELGDKTFFIAAVMAMRHSRITVFMGAISALAIMTILSACLGFATTVIPRTYTHYISTALFAIFGLKMLKEGYSMPADEGKEEFEDVQKDINKREVEEYEGQVDVETGIIKKSKLRTLKRRLMMFVSRIFIEAFTMTFLAEWGDRSQLTTIILAAREDAIGVTLGAIIGHGICTSLAVIGGRIIAQRISVRSVTLIGGVVFLIFAVWALAIGPGT